MTEQEFRDALKRQVGQTGLSSDRRYRVLAGMNGGESKVRTWNKMKIALVMAALVVLGISGAVAGNWNLVDWQGEPLQANRVEIDQRMSELMEWRMKGKWASIVKWNEERDTYSGILASKHEVSTPSVEKLRTWVTEDGMLPWPEHIPESYQQVARGSVQYVCSQEGEIRLRSQETTEDGYTISYFEMPQKHRLAAGYDLILRDDESGFLQIYVTLTEDGGTAGHPIMAGDTFTELHVEGMLTANAIESASQTRVALRQAVEPALAHKSVTGYPDGTIKEYLSEYDCLEIIIIGQGTPEDLLAIFGLTTE